MKLLYKSTAMESLRKWFYKPKRDDRSLLAQFFYADETLNMVAAELDSFDGREDPERCSTLVNQLRHAQEHVLNITNQIMDQLLGSERVARGFRVKFPEDVLQDNLAGQLWFGAECLAAGSFIMNREAESSAMRPLARALTRSLETVRALLREHCLRCNQYGASLISCCSEMLHESLKIFDRLFAEFELCYVSAMVPVKTPKEFEVQQLICVLFSETLQRARRIGLLTQDQVDDYDPALMFAIPRLAIVSGLLIYSSGPLSIDKPTDQMSDMFRPFRILLQTIKQLLLTLDKRELYLLEKLLCTNEDIANIRSSVDTNPDGSLALGGIEGDGYPDISEFVTRFYSDNSHCKDVMMNQMDGCEWGAPGTSSVPYSVTNTISEDLNIEKKDSLTSEEDTNRVRLERSTTSSDNNVTITEDSTDTVTANPATEMEVNLDTAEASREKDLHCRTDDIIRLSVQAAEEVSPTEGRENELETTQDSLNTTLTVTAERRNSNRSIASSRKSSRNESICSNHGEHLVRNLSHNGLSMFDPLAATSTSSININPTASDNNVLIPDQLLISNLSDQVSEIADKLSHITYGEIPENTLDNMRTFPIMDSSISNLLQDQLSGQIYSFSSNDVSNLGASRTTDPEFQISRNNVNYSPSRNNDKHANMPSTSHGYLIPNAISHEPAILATLSNNPLLEEEMFLNPINNPMTMSQQGINLVSIENEMFGDSISVANANLSSLLLTNEEYQNRLLSQNNYDTSSNMLWNIDEASGNSNSDDTLIADNTYDMGQKVAHQRAKFLVGYESDCNEKTPADSGICTENTSLDRSPDSEIKDINNAKNSNNPSSTTVDEKLNSQNLMAQSSENNVQLDSNNIRIDSNNTWGHLDQNCILSNDNNPRLSNEDKTILDVSTSQIGSTYKGSVDINVNNDSYERDQGVISSFINYSEGSVNVQKNEAGSSQTMSPEFVQSSNEILNITDAVCANPTTKSCDINLCSNSNNLNSESVSNVVRSSCVDSSDVIQRTSSSNDENVVSSSVDNIESANNYNEGIDSNTALINIDNTPTPSILIPESRESSIRHNVPSSSGLSNIPEQSGSSSSSTGVLKQRKLKKSSSSSSPKNKKKSSRSRGSSREFRVWSPGRFVLENNRPREQRTPLKLNLEQYVDETLDWNSSQSSATSSFHSECADDEEIALALQAQELAARHHTRAKFSSSEDLIHRLFVCIAGVADQLQTNFASDLRNILKSVFLMNQTPEIEPEKSEDPPAGASISGVNAASGDALEYQASESEVLTNGDSFDSIYSAEEVYADNNSPTARRSQHNLPGAEGATVNRIISGQSRQNSQKSLDSKKSEGNPENNDNVSRTSNQEDNRSNQSNSPRSTSRKTARSSSSNSSDSGRNQHADYDNSNVNSNRIPQPEQRLSGSEFRSNAGGQLISQSSGSPSIDSRVSNNTGVERAPEWVPDIAAPNCMRCRIHFTAFRRRHHCRNCGKVFCASCSSNSIPLPRFGQMKPVRVCEECFQTTSKHGANQNSSVISTNSSHTTSTRRQNVR